MLNIVHIKKLEQGKQGITGLVTIDNVFYVYKISQYMNYLVDHEYLILNGLNELNRKCPHFCRLKGKYQLPIHPNFRDEQQDPFEYHKRPIYLNVIFIEYIKDSHSLYSLIKSNKYSINEVLYYIKQTLITIIISQKYKKFVHYDLHSMNILLDDCDKNNVNVYVLDENNSICVPTLGKNIKIIDYGFGYSKDLENNPSYISLAYTDAGYMSPAFDSIADVKLFLVSVIEDLSEVYNSNSFEYKYLKKYKNIVYNIFKSLNIDWRSGWDYTNDIPIIDKILDYIEDSNERSHLFSEYSNFCIDMLQSLIILPYKPKIESSMSDVRLTYKVFVKEFIKIEEEISNPFYSLYILRKLIDFARDIRDKYVNLETKEEAIRIFQTNLFNEINNVAKYCTLKTLNCDKLLCSLFLFADELEYQLYKMLNRYMEKKYSNYLTLDVDCTEHVLGILDLNFKDEYIYNEDNIFQIYNCIKDENKSIKLNSQEINILNNLNHVLRGQFIYSIYNGAKLEVFDINHDNINNTLDDTKSLKSNESLKLNSKSTPNELVESAESSESSESSESESIKSKSIKSGSTKSHESNSNKSTNSKASSKKLIKYKCPFIIVKGKRKGQACDKTNCRHKRK